MGPHVAEDLGKKIDHRGILPLSGLDAGNWRYGNRPINSTEVKYGG
jgi:hypothetical protein